MILVTGATETIGSEVVKCLLGLGADLRAGVRSSFLLSSDVLHEAAMVEAGRQAGARHVV